MEAEASTQSGDYEVIIIGAGVTGIYQLYRLRELGISCTVLEAGGDAGGTWYWNRYPGARFDSESYSYGYSFSEELLHEWKWSEHFAAQPETLSYLQHVVEKYDLRQHMQFNCRVRSARFLEEESGWQLELEDGRQLSCRILLTAIGMLSAATYPRIPGRESFKGESFHTYYWPHEPVSFTGKKVAVIGTGATGVQVIADIADKVGSLTVFQRRPNWCAPLNNGPIDAEFQQQLDESWDEIFEQCRNTPGAFLHGPVKESFWEKTPEERRVFWEKLYTERGFGIWLGNYSEVLMDEAANREFCDFMAEKIRGRVNDPAVAEKLIPSDHGFGARRVPMETRYFEAYNRDNVRLVDLTETPIEAVTETGICTTAETFEFDMIIYATGFDAITGSFDRIEIAGTDGQLLRDKWQTGPRTYLGLQTTGFPNMMTLAGPQGASVSTNFPRAIEEAVDWATRFVVYLRDHGYRRFEAIQAAEDEWQQEVERSYEGLMAATTPSWFTGYNSNVDGHNTLRYMVYFGGQLAYRDRLEHVASHDYEGIRLE